MVKVFKKQTYSYLVSFNVYFEIKLINIALHKCTRDPYALSRKFYYCIPEKKGQTQKNIGLFTLFISQFAIGKEIRKVYAIIIIIMKATNNFNCFMFFCA